MKYDVLDSIDREIDCQPMPSLDPITEVVRTKQLSASEASLHHLRHFLEGYRSRALQYAVHPYAIGTARFVSWMRGWIVAGIDERLGGVHRYRSGGPRCTQCNEPTFGFGKLKMCGGDICLQLRPNYLRCQHQNPLADYAGNSLQPSCGCKTKHQGETPE